eukprot:m.110882 g.110882  ORF g.110882 m.110882 type:complete len:447 (+) comp9231_c0_seq2:128-1468(+)
MKFGWRLVVVGLIISFVISVAIFNLHPSEYSSNHERSLSKDRDASNNGLLSPGRQLFPCEVVDKAWKSRLNGVEDKNNVATIAFVGDISFARDINRQLEDSHQDPSSSCHHLFKHMKRKLDGVDMVIGNLESPGTFQTKNDPLSSQTKRITLEANPKHFQCLKELGIKYVTLANNHALDSGEQSFRATVDALNMLDIGVVGVISGNKHISTTNNEVSKHGMLSFIVKNVKIGLLAFCQVSSCEHARHYANIGPQLATSLESMVNVIRESKGTVDVLVVIMHWGREYYTLTTTHQQSQAYLMRSAGANIIIGHHQHVLQDHEVSPIGAIMYGLGNFLFDSHVCRDPATFAINHNISQACTSLPPGMRNSTINNVMQSRIYKILVTSQGIVGVSYLPLQIVHDEFKLHAEYNHITSPIFIPIPNPTTTWTPLCGLLDKSCLACTMAFH